MKKLFLVIIGCFAIVVLLISPASGYSGYELGYGYQVEGYSYDGMYLDFSNVTVGDCSKMFIDDRFIDCRKVFIERTGVTTFKE